MTTLEEISIQHLAESIASSLTRTMNERAAAVPMLIDVLRRTFRAGRSSAMTEALSIAVRDLDGTKYDVCRLLQEAAEKALEETKL